jgi:glycosyltransferase involved in cell wall biosynthesis
LRLLYVADARSVHTQRWLQWFADHGHEVHVVTDTTWTGPSESVHVHSLPDVAGDRASSLGQIKRSPRMLRKLRRWTRDLDPALVHGHFLLGYGHLALAASAGIRPLALTAWGSDVYLLPTTSRMARSLTRISLMRAGLVTGDSVDLNELLVRSGARADATHLVSFGVDTSEFRPVSQADARAQLGLPLDVPLVLSPRSLRSIYNIDVVVEAFALVQQQLPDTHLVIKDYRGDADVIAAVRSRITTLKVEDRVIWIDEVPHSRMPLLYAAADATISLADSDSAPLTLLESWACGTPVVCSDLPSVREWMRPDELAMAVPPRAASNAASAVAAVLAAPWTAEDAADHRRRVLKRADFDTEMHRVEELYGQLAQPTRQRQR